MHIIINYFYRKEDPEMGEVRKQVDRFLDEEEENSNYKIRLSEMKDII